MEHAIIQSRQQFLKSGDLHFYDSHSRNYFSLFDLFLRRKACDSGLDSHLLYFLPKPTLSILSTIVGFFLILKQPLYTNSKN